MFGWVDWPSLTGLNAIVSHDLGETWELVDTGGAPAENARYARVCAHPTSSAIVCVAYQHSGYGVDSSPYPPTEIYVMEFNLETLQWGSKHGGVLPEAIQVSAVLKGIGARSSDLVLAVVDYSTDHFVAHFLELSLTLGWGSAYQCADITPAEGYIPSQTIEGSGLVVDGDDNCHVMVTDANTVPKILNHCVLYPPAHPVSPNTVLTTLVAKTSGWPDTFTCNLVWHPQGVVLVSVLTGHLVWNEAGYWEADTPSEIAFGYMWDDDTTAGTGFSFNLDERWGAGRPTGYVVGNRIYLFLEADIEGTYKYLVYDPSRFTNVNRGDLHIMYNVEDLFPSSTFWDGHGSTFYYAAMPESGRVAGVFGALYGQYYFEQEPANSSGSGYVHLGRGFPTSRGGSKGFGFFG
jgi:hypothetical protein